MLPADQMMSRPSRMLSLQVLLSMICAPISRNSRGPIAFTLSGVPTDTNTSVATKPGAVLCPGRAFECPSVFRSSKIARKFCRKNTERQSRTARSSINGFRLLVKAVELTSAGGAPPVFR
jgi:hypothetical protein